MRNIPIICGRNVGLNLSTNKVQQGALLSYLWSFFSESSDGKQVVFEAEEGDVIFEIEMEDR